SLTTLEGCPNTLKQCQSLLQKFKIQNVTCVNAEFSEQLSKYQSNSFDLIYFDGNHSKAATLNYFETLLPTTHNDSVWIFDDIHWSIQMEEAWEIIKNHPQVTVSIDTFQWGIVFFRTEQVKEDFIIRVNQSFISDNILGIKNLWGLIK
ncbi:class I SAM-dependent methyltransferase, partial [Flavobacterium sp.]|uniref:class I SAM-dependent methyltransferase n=1 Tax=Flavobacterium sp. TaxID=239 RepID=UPI00261944A6